MVADAAKILLVTADDLGLCPSVTDGILEAARHGIVRAASLLVVGEDAPRAVKLAQRETDLRVGIHLALVDGRPLLPAREVASLIDDRGRFFDAHPPFVRRYLLRRIDRAQVYAEWRAQLEQTIAWGITPAHLDSHQHLHLLPGLFEITLRLCREFKVPRLRVPCGPGFAAAALHSPAQAALELLSRRAARALHKQAGVKMCQRFLGRAESCQLSVAALLKLIDKVRPGTQELMCHPGRPDAAALFRHPFGRNWGQELLALQSDAVKARIARHGIVLRGAL